MWSFKSLALVALEIGFLSNHVWAVCLTTLKFIHIAKPHLLKNYPIDQLLNIFHRVLTIVTITEHEVLFLLKNYPIDQLLNIFHRVLTIVTITEHEVLLFIRGLASYCSSE